MIIACKGSFMWNLRSALLFIVVLLVGGVPGLAQRTIDTQAKVSPQVTVPADKLIPDDADARERYRIGFQDVLDVQVFRHPDLSMRVPVSSFSRCAAMAGGWPRAWTASMG